MKNKKGFTLIELLAVIAILAILVIIAIPTVLQLFQDAKANTFRTQAQQIFKAAEQQYMNDSISEEEAPTSYCQDGNQEVGILDLSGSSAVEYKIEFSGNAISAFTVKDGNYALELDSETGFTIDAIKNAELLIDEEYSAITITCGDS